MCHAFNKNNYVNFKSGKIKEKGEISSTVGSIHYFNP